MDDNDIIDSQNNKSMDKYQFENQETERSAVAPQSVLDEHKEELQKYIKWCLQKIQQKIDQKDKETKEREEGIKQLFAERFNFKEQKSKERIVLLEKKVDDKFMNIMKIINQKCEEERTLMDKKVEESLAVTMKFLNEKQEEERTLVDKKIEQSLQLLKDNKEQEEAMQQLGDYEEQIEFKSIKLVENCLKTFKVAPDVKIDTEVQYPSLDQLNNSCFFDPSKMKIGIYRNSIAVQFGGLETFKTGLYYNEIPEWISIDQIQQNQKVKTIKFINTIYEKGNKNLSQYSLTFFDGSDNQICQLLNITDQDVQNALDDGLEQQNSLETEQILEDDELISGIKLGLYKEKEYGDRKFRDILCITFMTSKI